MIRTYLGAFAARVFAAIADAVAFLLAHVFVFSAGTQAIAQVMTAHCAQWRCPPQQPSEFRELKPVPARRFGSAARRLTSFASPLSAVLLLALAALLAAPMPIQAAGNAQLEPCSGGGFNPTPTAVEVDAVPIVVESTTDDYFVLYVKHDVDGAEVELPVLVKLGESATTTLAENVEALPKERYRVEKYLIADPADVDGDCVDDITELNDLGAMNPVNPAADVPLNDGAVALPDRATFETYAYADSDERLFLKYLVFDVDTDRPRVYFQNSNLYNSHGDFTGAIGLTQVARFRGSVIYDPALVTPDGRPGVYYYENAWEGLSVGNSFAHATRIHTVIAASMPLLEDNLALYFPGYDILNYQDELTLFKDSRIPLLFDSDIVSGTDFLALNPGEGYGRLRVLASDERPHARDIALYEALPNELPRVAGIISTVPQTPLSHVNLRAIQDGIPNAFIRDARDDPAIAPLIDGFVRYEVTDDGWELHTATKAEVDAHYEAARPAQPQTPERDLAVTGIKPLSQIGFEDWTAFGVKAANVAVLGTLRFPAGTVPDGFAIPFYFYDEFMKVHDFYTRIETMLADPDFQTDFEVQDDMLDDLRDDIEDADSPRWIVDDLTTMHATYPEGQSLRYRSSTNNEDLPGFNGAGLYDSKTQNPDETVEDGIDKSLKGVFASLWTFRAFTEREFYRIDHLATAMGVLVHPNYKDELANGVAVSFDPTDPLYGNDDWYYVNTQVGEDLVTNPEAHSVPEEILIYKDGTYRVLAISNQVPLGQLLMSNAQLTQLRDHLTAIHDHFEALYDPATGEPFAMEIEFKITNEDILAIKQARPWVFGGAEDVTPPPPPPPPPVTGGGGGGPRQTVPGAPTNLVAEATDGAVVLTWEAPEADGGSAITDYQYGINRRGWTSIGSADTIHTVTGLVNDTLYVFQVRAVNRVGRSPASDPAEATPRADVALDFAHFANGAGITSEIVLVNVAPYPIRPTIYFYAPAGDLIDPESVMDVTGDLVVTEDGALTVQTEMESVGVFTISTHGRGELVSGSVKVVTDGPMGGFLRFNLPDIGAAGVGASPPVRDVLFPARRQAGGINTGVALHNLDEEAMGVRCRLMRGGAVLEEVEIPLAANGQTSGFINDVFIGTDTSDFVGSVRCTAAGRFTGIALELGVANRIFTTLPVLTRDPSGSRGGETVLDFAHFANGAGITSELVFVNLSNEPSRPAPTPFHSDILPSLPVLYFYDPGGALIAPASVVDLTGDLVVTEDGALTVQTEIEPLGVLTISTHGRGHLLSGSVKVVSGGPIGGVLRFDLPEVGVAGVGTSPPVSDAIVPVRRQQDGLNTGIAIHNLESSPELVRCDLMQEGVRLDAANISLAANGQDARFIDQMFPTADTSDFVGAVRCAATAGGLFTAVALEMDPGNRIFTTLPVVPVEH